jgi:hypothetical protein
VDVDTLVRPQQLPLSSTLKHPTLSDTSDGCESAITPAPYLKPTLFNIHILDIAFYDRALSAPEIRSLYEAALETARP